MGISGVLQTKVIELGSVDTKAQSECPCCGTRCVRACVHACILQGSGSTLFSVVCVMVKVLALDKRVERY